tara:strand:+ start:539 stop:1264 length:726 start_codon:yes stop_codon:yes gene_type:complete
MAYQKLQPTQAADVILSDTINPIDPSRPNKVSGTADGDFTDFLNDISVATESYTGTPGVVEADKLNVTGASPDVSFTNVKVGDTIVNVTTSAYTQVTAVDSDKILSLSDDIFGSLSDDYAVYTSGFFALGIYIGDIVWNSTSKSYALVTAVYSAQLALSSDIFNAADKFAVYSNTSLMNSNTDAFVVYVGGGASSNIDIKVTTAAGNDIVFSGFPKGGFLPVQCLRVWTTGTAATNVVALW